MVRFVLKRGPFCPSRGPFCPGVVRFVRGPFCPWSVLSLILRRLDQIGNINKYGDSSQFQLLPFHMSCRLLSQNLGFV